ncbi:MAG: hypothetical protein GY789_28185 [Hyphomicrobiales bacterium]|nr:hypothetical protein [Hyphomicrobiales bacterium]MCP5000170.1 hypothetical protein [Hyphomicrobiales bacterium]
MKPNDTIQSIESELIYVQNEINRRRSHIDEDLELIPDPIGRYHNLQRIDELRSQRNRLKVRLREAQELVPT